MNDISLANAYRNWVWYDYGELHPAYRNLYEILFQIPFKVLVPMDENRTNDGLYLRKIYESENGFFAGDGDCSVMEMLIPLAKKMDEGYIGSTVEKDTFGALWHFLTNLEIQNEKDVGEVKWKVNYWVNRKYDDLGKGSIFLLKHPVKDFNKIQIADQMKIYIKQMYER